MLDECIPHTESAGAVKSPRTDKKPQCATVGRRKRFSRQLEIGDQRLSTIRFPKLMSCFLRLAHTLSATGWARAVRWDAGESSVLAVHLYPVNGGSSLGLCKGTEALGKRCTSRFDSVETCRIRQIWMFGSP